MLLRKWYSCGVNTVSANLHLTSEVTKPIELDRQNIILLYSSKQCVSIRCPTLTTRMQRIMGKTGSFILVKRESSAISLA